MLSHAPTVVLISLLASADAGAAPEQNEWQTPAPARVAGPYSYERELTPAELERRPLRELILVRSTIEARAGRVFRPKWLRQYFARQPWYRPTGFVEARLTALDRKNAATISRVLTALGPPEWERRLKDFEARQRATAERAALIVATSPQDLAISAHRDGALRLWDLRRGRYRVLEPAGPFTAAGLVAFSSDGHLALAMRFDPAHHNWVNSVWDVDRAAFVRRVEIDRRCTNHFASLPKQNLILVECVGQIDAFDWVAGRFVGSFSVGRRDVIDIAVSADGQTLLVIHGDTEVTLWKLARPTSWSGWRSSPSRGVPGAAPLRPPASAPSSGGRSAITVSTGVCSPIGPTGGRSATCRVRTAVFP